MTDPAATDSAEARAAAAESRAIAAEAKLGVAQNERDVAVKTAEAADVINKDLVGRVEEVSRNAGRAEGVNEVLKEQLQKLQTTPHAQLPDQKPVLDSLARIEDKLNKQSVKPPLSKEGKEEEMFKRLFFGLLVTVVLLLAVGGAFAAFVVMHPPGKGEPATVTSSSSSSSASSSMPSEELLISSSQEPSSALPSEEPTASSSSEEQSSSDLLSPATAEIPSTTSVAGQADSQENRTTEMSEMCPAIGDDLRYVFTQMSFEEYSYYLSVKCRGYQTALVKSDEQTSSIAVQPLTADELAELKQLLKKQAAGL